jgi:signal transduction histidine kinase
MGEPALYNLLSCLLPSGGQALGQIVLANKAKGFLSHDSTALQMTAHLLSRQLRLYAPASSPARLPTLLATILDQIDQGILVLDPAGRLLFANATWSQWTGFAAEELIGRKAPWPFWVSHQELATLGRSPPQFQEGMDLLGAKSNPAAASPNLRQISYLPFRHRKHSLFWCRVETLFQEINKQRVAIALLQKVSTVASSGPEPAGRFLSPQLPEIQPPKDDSLALLLRPGASIDFWDESWEKLTGISQQDLAGQPAELVLDWMFPRQADREFIADLLNQPTRRGAQAIVEVTGRKTSRSLPCTFLPIRSQGGEAWLILVSELEPPIQQDREAQRFLRQLTSGLAHLLNNYLTLPVGLAELALDRSDLPADLARSFSQILENCMRAGRLVAALQDLAAEVPADKQSVSLAGFVREFLSKQTAAGLERDYELVVETRDDDAQVEVNPRMLKVVLEHLLTNAVQALQQRPLRRIQILVSADESDVCCQIQDSGGGLPVADWTAVLAPFYSTKGSFAQDPYQRGLDALGLGLTVSQHLLALHGGRLELHSVSGEGTTARIILPRAGRTAVREPASKPANMKT